MEFYQDSSDYIIRLEKGEEVFRSLEELAIQKNWQAGTLWGIGAVQNIEMGYFDIDKKSYPRKNLSEVYELLNMQGNMSYVDNKPFFHIHGVLSNHTYQCIGGHFFSLEVAVTCEIRFKHFSRRIDRKLNSEIGIGLLDLCQAH